MGWQRVGSRRAAAVVQWRRSTRQKLQWFIWRRWGLGFRAAPEDDHRGAVGAAAELWTHIGRAGDLREVLLWVRALELLYKRWRYFTVVTGHDCSSRKFRCNWFFIKFISRFPISLYTDKDLGPVILSIKQETLNGRDQFRILVRAISYTVHGLIPASCVFADR